MHAFLYIMHFLHISIDKIQVIKVKYNKIREMKEVSYIIHVYHWLKLINYKYYLRKNLKTRKMLDFTKYLFLF